VLHVACCKCRTQKSRQKSPSRHHRTTLSGYIFATKARIDNRKKNSLSSNISSTCPHNMVNFGPLAAEIVSLVWGTPGNFNGFRVLAALLHGILVGVSQTLRRQTEGATYIRQGGHHVGHWPTFLVINYYYSGAPQIYNNNNNLICIVPEGISSNSATAQHRHWYLSSAGFTTNLS